MLSEYIFDKMFLILLNNVNFSLAKIQIVDKYHDMTVNQSLHIKRVPPFPVSLELLKPITWFPPMWAFACGIVSSGLNISDHLVIAAAGILLAGPIICGMSQAINDWGDQGVNAINEPIDPDTVFFGLILVSFFPPKVFPKTYPPTSEKIQIISIVKKKYLSIRKTLKQIINAIKRYIKKNTILIIR